MAYKSAADGVVKKGKTDVKVFPNDGAKVGIQSGKGSKGASSVTSKSMKAVGRNMARANNQKKG
jgi:hypothetical protein